MTCCNEPANFRSINKIIKESSSLYSRALISMAIDYSTILSFYDYVLYCYETKETETTISFRIVMEERVNQDYLFHC